MIRFVCAVLLAALSAGAFTVEDNKARNVLDKAVRFYTVGSYDSTIAVIRAFLKENGKNPAAEYLVPLIMEAFLRTGDGQPVGRLYDLYHKKYRSSPFMPRVYYLRGYSLTKEKSWSKAFEHFSKALEAGVSDSLDSIIMTGCESVCRKELSEDDLHDICKDRDIGPRIKEIACYFELEKTLASDNLAKAKKKLNNFIKDYPDSRFKAPLDEQIPAAPTPAPGKGIAVGLLAELSGEEADIGKKVSQGVQLAIDKYNLRAQTPLRIVTYDTKGQLIEAARKAAQLVETDRASMIIGPLLSSTATVAAAMVRDRETVLLTPTATDEGIASLGQNIFQMNITLGTQSVRAARYAQTNLNIKEFSIIAPNTAYGAAMASHFREEAEKNGGTVFSEQFFEEGANDFSPLFSELRKKLIVRKMNLMRDPAEKSVAKVSWADSIKWADSSFSLGAIFMPGEADDIVMLAPQVSFNRIKAQLIGSSGWYSKKTVTVGKQYVQNAIFSTPFEPDTSWKKWSEFRREYTRRYREEPDRVAALGYDAGNLAVLAMENNGGSPKTSRIVEALSAVQKYEGASGVISFDPVRHTNTEAVIFKLTANGFVRIQ
jgi:ABC-type branched-subunit amino acid transport system substrate-binding protein